MIRLLIFQRCEIMPDLGNQILEDIRQFILKSHLKAYNLKFHDGFWRFLGLRHSVARDAWMVNIVTRDRILMQLSPLPGCCLKNIRPLTPIVNNITDSKSGVSLGKEEICLYGQGFLIESFERL